VIFGRGVGETTAVFVGATAGVTTAVFVVTVSAFTTEGKPVGGRIVSVGLTFPPVQPVNARHKAVMITNVRYHMIFISSSPG
jgi:hypothetical protein